MKKQTKAAIGLRAILPPNKTIRSAKDYNRQADKTNLRKEVANVR